MADEKIKLKKDFLTNQDANNTIDRSFSELISKKTQITLNEFFDYYNYLFYDIPRVGDLSHTELADRSREYIGNPGPYLDPRDQEIQRLNAEIDSLQQDLNGLEQGVFAQELNDLTKTVIVNVNLKDGDWPNDPSRVQRKNRKDHRLIFNDFIESPKYIDNSYNYFRNNILEFKTMSPTFTLWYTGVSDVRNNRHEKVWRSQEGGTYKEQTYSIPSDQKILTVNFNLDPVKLDYTEAEGGYPKWSESYQIAQAALALLNSD